VQKDVDRSLWAICNNITTLFKVNNMLEEADKLCELIIMPIQQEINSKQGVALKPAAYVLLIRMQFMQIGMQFELAFNRNFPN